MKHRFYARLAWNNIKKNARLYVPNILTGAGLNAVFYIIFTLSQDNRLRDVRGGSYLPTIMPLGVVVVALLSLILILYTNSFLMKQRNREFGLYNVLGMEKRHIGCILFWETVISTLCVLTGGLVTGIILYKVCALFICRMLQVDSVLGFYHVSPTTLIPSGLFFLVLYLLTYLINRIHISRMNPIELMQSTHAGEKEPPIRWLLLLIGIASLSGGYYISITTEEPLKAITLFFLAVILVIIGTYCLFITGSIALLKLLKQTPSFYYHKRHMIAVSGLLYRMKQNAVGLASITILATMVLVMISTTVSMYAGIDDTLQRQYVHPLTLSASYNAGGKTINIPDEDLLAIVHSAAKKHDLKLSFAESQHYLACTFGIQGNTLVTDSENVNISPIMCWFITAEEYKTLTGKSISLSGSQAAVCDLQENSSHLTGSLTIGKQTLECSTKLDSYPINLESFSIVDCYGFVVSDETVLQEIYKFQKAAYGDNASEITNELVVDFKDKNDAAAVHTEFTDDLSMQIAEYASSQPGYHGEYSMKLDSEWDMTEYLFGMYGTLLFLGILLSIVFLFTTALIIYYKQISEGYDDRSRFQIMQKVGMSANEVKESIRSQILLIFFLPPAAAAVHVAFAFPILTRLLNILFQSDQLLFMKCTLASLGVFAVIYIIIYSITANIYYQIVR